MSRKLLIASFATLLLITGWALWKQSPVVTQTATPEVHPPKATASMDPVKFENSRIVIKPENFSPETKRKLVVLDEIFSSKNDNDPRLDSEFKELTPELKEALVQKYESLKKESLNERGTIVFLIGKSLASEADLSFMQDVLLESPCLSLSDCSQEVKLENPDDDHLMESQEMTLVYPQVMALRLLDKNQNKEDGFQQKVDQVIRNAQSSPSEVISTEAARLSP